MNMFSLHCLHALIILLLLNHPATEPYCYLGEGTVLEKCPAVTVCSSPSQPKSERGLGIRLLSDTVVKKRREKVAFIGAS
jgi:hypothetical protein